MLVSYSLTFTADGAPSALLDRAVGAAKEIFDAAGIDPYLARYCEMKREMWDRPGFERIEAPSLIELEYAQLWDDAQAAAIRACFPGPRSKPVHATLALRIDSEVVIDPRDIAAGSFA